MSGPSTPNCLLPVSSCAAANLQIVCLSIFSHQISAELTSAVCLVPGCVLVMWPKSKKYCLLDRRVHLLWFDSQLHSCVWRGKLFIYPHFVLISLYFFSLGVFCLQSSVTFHWLALLPSFNGQPGVLLSLTKCFNGTDPLIHWLWKSEHRKSVLCPVTH